MCECGCVGMDERYRFPAPNRAFYLLTLSGACAGCDSPSGISIELCEPGSHNYKYYGKEYPEALDGQLKFEDWPDSKGVAIVTGMTEGEFIKAMMSHLVGVSSKEMGTKGRIDEAGAGVILEEMYDDATSRPKLLTPKGPTHA
jgi:hypothetical protein